MEEGTAYKMLLPLKSLVPKSEEQMAKRYSRAGEWSLPPRSLLYRWRLDGDVPYKRYAR